MLKPTSVFAAMADAERAALDHVRWLRRQGVPLHEAAAAIVCPAVNCRNHVSKPVPG
jgi:hypothetical protein